MLVIAIELIVIAALVLAAILLVKKINKDERTLFLMRLDPSDVNDPCYQELGLLLHGKREWARRMAQHAKIMKMLEERK
jgi:hypothetical protein